MNTRAIDYITEDFYESLSFQDGEMPDLETTLSLFFGDGLLINNTFSKPISFSAASFVNVMESQIESGKLTQFMQRELYAKTESFGKVAQRISVYEYSFDYHERNSLRKGVSYIQFVQDGDNWLISSMAWNDEGENYRIPSELVNG